MIAYILIAASIAVGLLAGNDLPRVAGYFVEGLSARSTLEILGVVTLIEMLTVFLQLTGSFGRILAALRRVIEDPGILIALVPSLMGIIPVPGGAMLSAPMVGVYGDELGMDRDLKSAINLFFRHLWDLVVPFKPHLILSAVIFDIPLFTLIGWHIPVTLLAALMGYWFMIARHRPSRPARDWTETDAGNGQPLWVALGPLLIPLVLTLALGIGFVYAMALGLAFGLATQRPSRNVLDKMVRKGIRPKMLLIVASVMVFKTVLEHTTLVGEVATALTGYGVSLELLTFALPMVVGCATGVELAGVAIVFPLLVSLIPVGTPALPYMLVMMLTNTVGQIVSPAHFCVVVGNEYFGARMGPVLRNNLFPQAFRVAAGVAFAWVVAIYLGVGG